MKIRIFKKEGISNYDIIAIIAVLGITAWLISDFFGGMILILFTYPFIVIPIVILYVFSFIDTTISLVKKRKQTGLIKKTAHLILILIIITFNLFHSDIFKSKRILTATLKDDLFHYTLVFRKNGVVENHANGIFGYSKIYYGKYRIENELIIFSEKPYTNDFIPDTLLLDEKQHAIFISKDQNGQFRKKKERLNQFEIE